MVFLGPPGWVPSSQPPWGAIWRAQEEGPPQTRRLHAGPGGDGSHPANTCPWPGRTRLPVATGKLGGGLFRGVSYIN